MLAWSSGRAETDQMAEGIFPSDNPTNDQNNNLILQCGIPPSLVSSLDFGAYSLNNSTFPENS